MLTAKAIAETGSVAMVVICGALAGHYAAQGMTLVQMAGAAVAVLGSVTVAVAVRAWPDAARQED